MFRKMKDGYAPLFINKKQRLEPLTHYMAENHPTKGFKVRPGWHICSEPSAPHLSKKGRVWCLVAFRDYEEVYRPAAQGGLWFIANEMVILLELEDE